MSHNEGVCQPRNDAVRLYTNHISAQQHVQNMKLLCRDAASQATDAKRDYFTHKTLDLMVSKELPVELCLRIFACLVLKYHRTAIVHGVATEAELRSALLGETEVAHQLAPLLYQTFLTTARFRIRSASTNMTQLLHGLDSPLLVRHLSFRTKAFEGKSEFWEEIDILGGCLERYSTTMPGVRTMGCVLTFRWQGGRNLREDEWRKEMRQMLTTIGELAPSIRVFFQGRCHVHRTIKVHTCSHLLHKDSSDDEIRTFVRAIVPW